MNKEYVIKNEIQDVLFSTPEATKKARNAIIVSKLERNKINYALIILQNLSRDINFHPFLLDKHILSYLLASFDGSRENLEAKYVQIV